MPATLKANVFVPEVATEVATAEFANQLALGYAGSPFVRAMGVDEIGQEGDTIKMPRWNAMSEFGDMTENVALTPEAMGTSEDTAVVVAGGNAAEITDFASLSGRGDASIEYGRQAGILAARYVDKKLVAEAETTALTSTVAATFSWNAFVDAIIGAWGDKAFEMIGGLIVHSKQLGDIMKLAEYKDTAQGVISGGPGSRNRHGLIGGYPVYVSDRLTVTAGAPNTYNALVLKQGALGLQFQRQLLIESDRDILKKNTVVSADVRFAPHLYYGVPSPVAKLVTQ